MQENVLRKKWKQFRNELNHQWSQLTVDDLNQIDGECGNLVFLIESRYGYTRHRAEREVDLFVSEFEIKLRRAA